MIRRAAALSVLALAGPVMAEDVAPDMPERLDIRFWQAVSNMNPYLSGGVKDIEAAAMVLEPLARYGPDGALIPYLAREIPTRANGGIAADRRAITWRLRDDITWSDGTPLTAEDVAFTGEYCLHPESGCAARSRFAGVEAIEAIDAHTVGITFEQAMPAPFGPFVGAQSPILQKAQFAECLGTRAPECGEQNFHPVGTGPFKVRDFRPNDVVVFDANPAYRDPDRPHFKTAAIIGGGDPAAAGRSVMETGEMDYAWNLQVAPEILERMEEGGAGVLEIGFGTTVERIEVNLTDPSPDLDAEIRATRAAPHPVLGDRRVRKALSLAIDRGLLAEIGYGPAARPVCDLIPAPEPFVSGANDACLEPDRARAAELLDDAGWRQGPDGMRMRGGEPLELTFTTSTNAVRQDIQALIQQWWRDLGIEVRLRNIEPSVYFGGDPGSPDTFQRFYSDLQMYANLFEGTDPQGYLGARRCGFEPRPETQWQGENINRYCDAEYDALWRELAETGKRARRAEIARALNDMLIRDYAVLPLVHRGRVSARATSLGGVALNVWDSELWNVAGWYRIEE